MEKIIESLRKIQEKNPSDELDILILRCYDYKNGIICDQEMRKENYDNFTDTNEFTNDHICSSENKTTGKDGR